MGSIADLSRSASANWKREKKFRAFKFYIQTIKWPEPMRIDLLDSGSRKAVALAGLPGWALLVTLLSLRFTPIGYYWAILCCKGTFIGWGWVTWVSNGSCGLCTARIRWNVQCYYLMFNLWDYHRALFINVEVLEHCCIQDMT